MRGLKAESLPNKEKTTRSAAIMQQQERSAAASFVDNRPISVVQRQLMSGANHKREVLQKVEEEKNASSDSDLLQRKEDASPSKINSGLPQQLRVGIESLSGMDMSNVNVHRNSSKPAQLNAHAYAQGNDIHLGPGQEQHLPHEAWHVVQQRQGRVKPTMQMAAMQANDDVSLEKEADVMGAKARQLKQNNCVSGNNLCLQSNSLIIQKMPITRRMYNLVLESESLEELNYALKNTNYSDELKDELRSRWTKEYGVVDMTDEDDASEPEITDKATDLAYDDQQTIGAEVALNNRGHQGDVFDSDIYEESYYENANIDLRTIQLKRTGGAMTGPKDYATSNLGGFQDAFYILAGDGSLEFSEKPTKSRHASYKPLGKKKKVPLKHSSITWKDPNLAGSKVNLNKHPNIKKLDTKNRPQHFGMADAIYSKKNGWKTAKESAEFRSGKWTWHHLPTKYEMVLVDMRVHALHGHNGGVYIW